ncbi:MAG: nucleoside monophosphate kinase, partial [Candidatus Pacearchaeota archaeon]|nr:nucleoside monophosphate kinase [Candidatus Pacearchaeota archaeon]
MTLFEDKRPAFFILLGRSGSGKGTQANLLEEKFGLAHISSGALLRERTKTDDFVGRKLHSI